ncbi:hypothetical protein [Endozoicomonas ascidiicola]|uniref:hypothetical protein n=1 Tax=Endozoicomonas ascidiicola TaxID=1698521 RepID=UPI000AEF48EA|nr:hypothetical protein [Endozoicomonas ascidiicola]
MSDAKLFRFKDKTVSELAGYSAKLEKDLQTLIEGNMEAFLGIRFMETEYTTGKSHKGRIDTLGLDENHCPVIVEYKRHSNDNDYQSGAFFILIGYWIIKPSLSG